MALPTIVFNSSTGSDSLASGAGPATALTGSSASTDGAGTVVTLDGSPDLSGVATDGSHVIYLADATAGARNFGKITAKDDGADTVTVANAFGLSLSGKSWAIGGKRATFDATTSRKLFENNSAAGDAMPGWIIQTETAQSLTSVIVCRRAGDNTSGFIKICGTSGEVVTQTANAACFSLAVVVTSIWFDSLGFQNTNGTKTSAYGIATSGNSPSAIITNCVFGHATNTLLSGIGNANAAPTWLIVGCKFLECTGDGISGGVTASVTISRSTIVDCAGDGIDLTSGGNPVLYADNLIVARNGGRGIHLNANAICYLLINSIIHGNSSSGLEMVGGPGVNNILTRIVGNIFSGNGVNGAKWSATPVLYGHIDNNAYYNNTSGARSNFPTGANDITLSADPFVDAASDDFNINNDAGGGADLRAATVTMP